MDRIVNSLKNKRFVFWEEVARDGAQAKTILTGTQRVEIAKKHSKMFGGNGPDHLVFAAGFVSIGNEEVKAIKQVADEVDDCYVAVNCRSSIQEINDSLNAVKSAKFPRVAYVLPVSESLCQLMLHKSPNESIEQGIDIAKHALDKANGIPVDVQLAASFDADPVFIADAAARLSEIGIAIAHLGDTRGILYPGEVSGYLEKMLANSKKGQLYGVHYHNDLGLALANNLESIKQGITLCASSWLGLAERNGLVPTEILTFLLAYESEKSIQRLGFNTSEFFTKNPDLKALKIIADLVNQNTGVPIKVTDPLIGTGVNSISTGTPFVDTKSFQPFNPYEVLGIPRQVFITQLANHRVVKEVSQALGFHLSDLQINDALEFFKTKSYEIGRSVFPDSELIDIFNQLKNAAK